MLAGLHDVRRPLHLVNLHPALTEELPGVVLHWGLHHDSEDEIKTKYPTPVIELN